jgi:hypothetical protein
MKINEFVPMTKRTGAGGSVTTVGGNEVSRSTPKIGGMQTTSYADGSVKQTSQTQTPDGANIQQTRVNGKQTTGNIASGTMSVDTKGAMKAGTPTNVTKMKYDMGNGTNISATPGSATITNPQGKKKTFGIPR